ncbi:penicillin-binding protein [Blattabacterium cuenoti]|uniref:penicillin-binding protein n=1 Tax=Blattabacterium cuenoti TaxID=1653831 RepID=UPI001EEAC3A7|nr:penicillin-binding protein [Blattabacterium cuenoti]
MKKKYPRKIGNIEMKIENKNRYLPLYKSYLIGLLFVFIALLIIFNLLHIQNAYEKYKKYIIEKRIKINLIPAKRGNIYSADNRILSTSVIKYDVHIDFQSISDELFNHNIVSLCNSLEFILKRPKGFFYKKFIKEKKKGNRYFLLAKNLDFSKLQMLQKLPIFNKGKRIGGFISEHKISRIHTLNIGIRTLGYDDHRGKIGIEGAFSKYLRGKDGKRLEQRISSNIWKPLQSKNEIDPEDGKDIHSTIDISLQDISYHALLQKLCAFKADHGCVVLMEVKSGKISVMINLEKTKNNTYEDIRNFSVWEGNEPGSTFKTIALLAALSDKKIDMNMLVDINGGVMKFKGKEIRDSHHYETYKKLNPKQILEISSNVGIAKLIHEKYKKEPEKFINHLYKWNLNKKIGIDIPGEGTPFIPKPGKKEWNEMTLPWMTFGYNIKLTPLQILTFYNAIANGGKMVKPMFVTEIRDKGKNIKTFKTPIVINPSIADQDSLNKIRYMLEGVVKNGTAKKYYHPKWPYAGKTGTTQFEYWDKNKSTTYISSFVGFFPYQKPKYTCIVVISKPKKKHYGVEVAVPVFDQIVQSIYTRMKKKEFPINKKRNQTDWKKKIKERKNIFLSDKKIMPNVLSLPGKEVIPLLENKGYIIQYDGIGKVIQQSIKPGKKIKKNQVIFLKLEK